MSDTTKKKPWAKPEVRKIELSDEQHERFMRQLHGEARMPLKRAK